MTRMRKLFLLSMLVLVAPVVLAACGGDDTADIDPEQVLNETFTNDEQVSSGTIDITLGGSVEGEQSGSGEATLSGSFQGSEEDPATLPQLDLTATVDGEAAGTSVGFEGGLVVTEDNLFIEYQGTNYEAGAELFDSFRSVVEMAASQAAAGATGEEGSTQSFTEQCATLLEAAGGNADACDTVDVYSWFELENEGEEEVEGAPTIHIHGTVDIPAMIENINATIAAADIPTATEIPEETASQIEDAVSELSFDVYSGVDDRLLRGLDLNVTVDPSAIPDASESGVTGVTGNFSTRIGAVNEPQTIDAPSDAQPLDDLLSQFGLDSAALQEALGGYMSQVGIGGLGATGAGGSTDFGAGGGGGGNADDALAQLYLQCLAEAKGPQDIKDCDAFAP